MCLVMIMMMSNTIGSNIKKIRLQHKMNQDVLAAKLNIRRQTISSYERGISTPDIYTLIKIADIFDISLDELAGRKWPDSECPGIRR